MEPWGKMKRNKKIIEKKEEKKKMAGKGLR